MTCLPVIMRCQTPVSVPGTRLDVVEEAAPPVTATSATIAAVQIVHPNIATTLRTSTTRLCFAEQHVTRGRRRAQRRLNRVDAGNVDGDQRCSCDVLGYVATRPRLDGSRD